jgi:beta-lactamase superfamily II metal-dependent hydrolase
MARLVIGIIFFCLIILALVFGYVVIANPSWGFIPRSSNTNSPTDGSILSIMILDVGQGDMILIDHGDYELLVDAGPDGTIPDLRNYINGPLEHVIVTHPHADHIEGIPAAFAAYQVSNFWTSGETSASNCYTSMMEAANTEPNCKVHAAEAGRCIITGCQEDGLQVKILHSGASMDTNNNSVVLEVIYGDTSILLTGDLAQDGESTISPGDVDILKVGHHGSCTSTSASFLTKITPEVAIYSAGTGNSYGHPCPDTISRLTAAGAAVYGTDTHGTITITTDGKTYSVTTGRNP